MTVVFSEIAWADFLVLSRDRRLLKRVNQLIGDILRGGNSGIGKPERLVGDMSGFWSRRIDDQHRLVYRLTEGGVEIIQCLGR